MAEPERFGMESLPTQLLDGVDSSGQTLTGPPFCREPSICAIDGIGQDWMPDMLQVHADLVSTAGLKLG